MMDDNSPMVRDRAYLLWEAAGKPNGREHEFWAQASNELEGDQDRRHKTSEGGRMGDRRSGNLP